MAVVLKFVKAFMERLGLWGDGTPFKAFETFLEGITKRGLGLFFLCLSWRMYICSGRNSSYIRKVVVYSKTAILHVLFTFACRIYRGTGNVSHGNESSRDVRFKRIKLS